VTKVALLGGDSQVGAEVALYLSLKKETNLICFVRSEYSTALLDAMSVPYLIVDYRNTKLLKEAFADCDIALDFTYPAAQPPDVWRIARDNILAVLSSMRKGSKYVYMSSIMAFGMPNHVSSPKVFVFPRTFYSHTKRKLERSVESLGRKFGIHAFIFRLGQVHGLLQSVTQGFISALSGDILYVKGKPTDLTNTAFPSFLVEIVMKCARNDLKPGVYTLVQTPQWTLEELFDYYRRRYGVQAKVVPLSSEDERNTLQQHHNPHFWSGWMAYRDMFEAYLFPHLPDFFPLAKGLYRVKRVSQELSFIPHAQKRIERPLLGQPPGKLVTGIPISSLDDIIRSEQQMEKLLVETLERRKR